MLYEVRCRSTLISLEMAGNALRMTSSVMGSSVLVMRLAPSHRDDQLARVGHAQLVAREQHRRRRILFDHGRAFDLDGRRELLAPVHGALRRARRVVEMDLARADTRVGRGARQLRKLDLRPRADRREAQVHELERLLERGVAEAAIVDLAEAPMDRGAVGAPDLALVDRHLQPELLAHVAQVEPVLEPAGRRLDAGVVERGVTVAQELREDAREYPVV